jgi:hypothetical protein
MPHRTRRKIMEKVMDKPSIILLREVGEIDEIYFSFVGSFFDVF